MLQQTALRKTCTPHDVADDNKDEVIEKMFDQMSSTCKRYTDVMALKNQLQCHVFSGTPDTATQLTPFIITLQTAAVKLQGIEVSIKSSFDIWHFM